MKVVVLGAGFGGLELTTRLSEELGADADVVLIDRNDGFVFGFSKLDVMFGRRRSDEVVLSYRDVVKPSVRFVQAEIRSIDAASRRVETDAGTFGADVLVVALGADLDPAATPGLLEAGHDFYTVSSAFAVREVLEAFEGGKVIVGVTSTPFKCPPAPSEAVLLLHDFLTERGLRDRSEISLVMPSAPPSRRHRTPRRSCSRCSPSAASRGCPTCWCASSTRSGRSPSRPTAPSCPSTCSWECQSTWCPRWSPSRACASTAGSPSTRARWRRRLPACTPSAT